MDRKKLLYRIAPDALEAGKGAGCTLCTLLQDYVRQGGGGSGFSESPELEFALGIDREEEEGYNFGPSPKNTPRLRITVDRPSLVMDYCLYTSPGMQPPHLLWVVS